MSKPIISICIPTLNRCEYLKETIKSIVNQPEFLDGSVEIVIADNASEDGTREMVSSFKEQYSAIVYHRNEKNIGNENFPLVLSLGHGILRKLNNDTLLFEKNSLKKLLDIVKQYQDTKPVLFFANSEVKKSEQNILSFNEFVVNASYWVTWIGGFSVWDYECEQIRNDTEGCKERLWQVRKVYELVSDKDAAVIVNYKYGNTQTVQKKNISYGLYQVFYVNFLNYLMPYLKSGCITQEEFDEVERDLLFNFFTNWMIAWEAQGTGFQYSESEDLVASIKRQYVNKPYWKEFEQYYAAQKRKGKLGKLKKSIKKFLGYNKK